MKKIFILFFTTALVLSGCNDKLEENPRGILTTPFLRSPQGFRAILDGAYAGTRYLWGQQDLFTMAVIGTDEFIRGQDGNSNINDYSSGYTPSIGQVRDLWRNCYTYINACNAVLDNAPFVTEGVTDAAKARMVAEAKFLRANYYFVLAQFYGGVTVLTNFQTTATTSAVRHSLSETYDLIISDLNDAIAILPPSPKTADVKAGEATVIAAKHVLAKVYLTRAGSQAQQSGDYAKAHTLAREIVDQLAPASNMRLLPDFGSVFEEGNEANDEVLWSSQHTPILAFNGSESQNNSAPDNMLHHFWAPQYELQPGMQRSTLYGRPYIRCVPTQWLLQTAFAQRVNDTRYGKTFQTVWYSNNASSIPTWNLALLPNTLPPGVSPSLLNTKRFQVGDTAIWMPGYAVTGKKMDETRYKIMCPANVNSAHYKVIDPKTGNPVPYVYEGYNKRLSPAMKKFFDTKRVDMNAPSTRPVIVYRLAETYLIAAEALMMDGQPGAAVSYVNAVRRRAAFPTGNPVAMEITQAQLSVDFLLDERARELCGENMRWWDLVRTGKLISRVTLYNADAKSNIKAKHVLRPIPQAQIDAVITGDRYPQNPDW